jgi:type IV pilus assembly protein PilV
VKKKIRPSRRRHQGGSTLIEVLISVLLFSLGVIGLLRALGLAMRGSGDIEFRSVAATMADERIGRMWVDRTNLATYAETNVAVPQLPSGTRTTTVVGNVVTVQIGWQAPGATAASNHSISATIASN